MRSGGLRGAVQPDALRAAVGDGHRHLSLLQHEGAARWKAALRREAQGRS